MVKHCSHGLCKSDSRYPEKLEGGVVFIPFPKPTTNHEKCLRWIKLCGRPHSQLNINNINSNRYVCSKHFVNLSGPTENNPDPFPADKNGTTVMNSKPTRAAPTKRHSQIIDSKIVDVKKRKKPDVNIINEIQEDHHESASQTVGLWTCPLDMMALAAENSRITTMLAKEITDRTDKERMVAEQQKEIRRLNGEIEELSKQKGIDLLDQTIENDSVLQYYTGFTADVFNSIYKFLVPERLPNSGAPFEYISKGRLKKLSDLSLRHQFFITMCKLRNNFDLLDLSFRFAITQQVVSVVFNTWINYMFLRFGEVSFWPSRNVLTEHMPKEFRKEFPNTFAILDCTEIKIQKPKSLVAQSQTYSDYKGTNTLKGLVVCDPRGSIIFCSMLFGGATSDKDIFNMSGLRDTLKHLMNIEYLIPGDGLMADKGFKIEQEVASISLKLNIPPFAHAGKQMSEGDAIFTKKIAKHRVHVERAIRRVKSFEILSGQIPLSLMSSIDQIWFVCCFLTNFMPPCIKDKGAEE